MAEHATDVRSLIEAERIARRRTEQLQAVTSALSSALTLPEVGRSILQQGAGALGASHGTVFLLNAAGDALDFIAGVGLSDELLSKWTSIPMTANVGAVDAIRTRKPVIIRSAEDGASRYPHLATLDELQRTPVVAIVPLMLDERAIGVMSLLWADTRAIDDADDFAFLERVASQATIAIERARLYHAEREAHERAEQSFDRARRLQRLTALLNEASTRSQIADVVFEGALAAVNADAGSLAFVRSTPDGEPDLFDMIRTFGYDQDVADRYREFPVQAGRPMSDSVLDRSILLVSSLEEWRAQYPRVQEDMAGGGFQAFASIPVLIADRVIAALFFSFRRARPFDDATRTFLSTIAEQCALALERQRLHDAEVRQSAQNAALLETIEDAFVAFDARLCFTYANATAEAFFGLPSRAWRGRKFDEALPDVAATPVYDAVAQALASRTTVSLEAWVAPLGRWVEARAYPAPEGVLLVCRDVTERKRAQGSAAFLAEASSLLAASLDYTSTLTAVARAAVPRLGDWCAISVVEDPTSNAWPPQVERVAVAHEDAERLRIGAELERLYPIDWSQPTGQPAVLRNRQPMFIREVTDAMLVQGARDERHLTLLRALQFGSIIVVPLVARGLTLGLLTLCTTELGRRYDDTDLALAEELAQRAAIAVDNARLYREAERARAEAELANVAKSKFLATMSHELRTPLNAIQGHVQLIDIGVHGPVTDAQREALARIERAERHLLGLIDDVLNYARVESGVVEFNIREVDVADVLEAVVPLIEQQLAQNHVRLVVRLPERDERGPTGHPRVPVLSDQEKLGQVMLNLLSNAAKFTPSNGTVHVELCTSGDDALITVRDTGPGVPSDKLEAIFQPFVQLRDKYAATPGGTGLGLAISRDLARGMGGELTAHREDDETVFTVRLKRASSTALLRAIRP